MANILEPDLCVIGGGSGGLSVAAAARAFGSSVVLVEKDKMGGDCLNVGCVPSKALIAAAKHAHIGQSAKKFGITYKEPKVNFAKVQAHVANVIAGIAPHDSVERFEALGANVINATAKFVDRRTLEANGQLIRARRFVIATGSRPAIPPIHGLNHVPYLTNENIFELKEKPAHLIIIGGGPIGMELAQAHQRLGARVTVVEMFDPLAKDDPELTAIALRRLQDDGVMVHANTSVQSVEKTDEGIALTIKANDHIEVITGSHLLVAAGRAPNIEALNLEVAHVKSDPQGIFTNKGMRTANRKIYAIGDVAHGFQFTHTASYQASIVIRSAIFGLPAHQNTNIIPWVTYTDPEIANVGLNEQAARKLLGDKFRVVRWSFAELDRARTERQTEGLAKMIVGKNGKILGCGMVGPQAGELISLFSFAIANNLKTTSLTKFIAPYPTLSEVARRLGIESFRDSLSNPWIGRWVNLIRLLP